MNRIITSVAILFLFSRPNSQTFGGEFYYRIIPREAEVGQSVRFAAYEFNMCLYGYDVTYNLVPTPISSIKTTIINIKATRKPSCALAAGYSGPTLSFENLDVGVYKIQFDSLSEFKKDLGDTSYFEIKPRSTNVYPRQKIAANNQVVMSYQANGKRIVDMSPNSRVYRRVRPDRLRQ